MIRVLIVEDQRMAREDMENYIQSSGRYSLEASITNAAMAETVCKQSRCRLTIQKPVKLVSQSPDILLIIYTFTQIDN